MLITPKGILVWLRQDVLILETQSVADANFSNFSVLCYLNTEHVEVEKYVFCKGLRFVNLTFVAVLM